MFKKLLEGTVGEIKDPERRLNVVMLIIAVSGLCLVIFLKDRKVDSTSTDAIIYLQRQNEIKDKKIDSLTLKIYINIQEANKEEIERLKEFVNNQNEQKKVLRKIKK